MSMRALKRSLSKVSGIGFLGFGLLTIVIPLLVSCGERDSEAMRKALVGKYELIGHADPNQIVRGTPGGQQGLILDTLILHDDGRFEQNCTFEGDQESRSNSGTWSFNRGVFFSKILDCSGFLDSPGERLGAGLITKMARGGPVILLNPDLSVYYAKSQ